MRCYELHLDNFKGNFLNLLIIFVAPSDSRFLNSCISDKYFITNPNMEIFI